MAKDVKVELRRKARVRRAIRERAYGRLRLSVFRSRSFPELFPVHMR